MFDFSGMHQFVTSGTQAGGEIFRDALPITPQSIPIRGNHVPERRAAEARQSIGK